MGDLPQRIVEDWIKETTGTFTYADICNELGIAPDSPNREYLRGILKRLREARLVTYVDGTRHGVFRRIDTERQRMNLTQANPKLQLQLRWPFGLERYVKIFRRNLIVIWGSKDAGKTALILNFIRLNMEKFKHKIQLFNVDMGSEEMRGRIEKFDDTTVDMWDDYILMEERATNFVDFIEPDWINIVDFLEVSTDFWRIGGIIKEMLDKVVGSGILIVAVQKNRDAEIGLGGWRTIERAKLVLTLDPGVVKIFQAKNWQEGISSSPKGKSWTYKLIGGTKIVNIQEVT